MVKPTQKEILDFWKENVIRNRKTDDYDLTETSKWVEINTRLDEIVKTLEAATKEDEIREILRRIFLPKSGLIWGRPPFLFFKLLKEGDFAVLRKVKRIILDVRKNSKFSEEWVESLYNLMKKKYPEGTKRFKAAKAHIFNLLGELFGKLHFEDNPVRNACSKGMLRKMGYDFDETKYDTFKEAFESFKKSYKDYIGKLSPKSMAMNVEIDQLFNFLDKDKNAKIFLRAGTSPKVEPVSGPANLRNWWVEKTYRQGRRAFGKVLASPQKGIDGRHVPAYNNMREIRKEDIVLHFGDMKTIVGISIVDKEYQSSPYEDEKGKRPGYLVTLRDYQELKPHIKTSDILNEKYRDRLLSLLQNGHYLFYNKILRPNEGAYLTKAPSQLIEIINEVYKEKNGKKLPFWPGLASPAVPKSKETLPPIYTIEEFINETGFDQKEIENWLQILRRKRQIIFQGPPGTGKTFVALRLARLLISGTPGFKEIIQFHPDYGYEDFIQGYYPEPKNGILHFELRQGRFLEFCERANKKANGAPCVLIIDEINRAHLARVFGELMYLLEYREEKIPLAAGGERFRIPSNIYLIGTMNTADRSIALVDHALRRRFSFIRLKPKYDILKRHLERYNLPADGLINVLKKINRAIDDQNYEVGISFFMKDQEKLRDLLPSIWKSEIEPYLEEYFYDQPGKVQTFRWESLVNDELKDWIQ